MASIIHSGTLWTFILVGSVFIAAGWGSNDKIRLTDVIVVTLHPGKMTNSRRTHPVPQLKCVGGTAGCSAFTTPRVVHCLNMGSNGSDVQWECPTDMNSRFKFGEIAVNCEGYDYPDDPYVLEDSCGLEYTIDFVDCGGHNDGSYVDRGGHNDGSYITRNSCSLLFLGVIINIIALVAIYNIYKYLTQDPSQQSDEDDLTLGENNSRSAYYNNDDNYVPLRSPLVKDDLLYYQPLPGYEFGGSNWSGSNDSWSSRWTSGFGGTTRR